MTKRPSGDLKMKVALITDTHVNEEENTSTSPYPANWQANPRARHAFASINAVGPRFVIHLGDMIHPVPELPSYGQAADTFRALTAGLDAPVHLMPGNHDIGDKPVSWMPAGTIDAETIAKYRQTFGRDYYAFEEDGCHFVIVNSPLINSGEPQEAEQAEWLERYLADHDGERVFLFSHYPPYIHRTDEPETYDNYGEPGRTWFLDLIRRYKPEALFSAHVHNFWYDLIGETEYYVMPSTCFVRHDYSEMYRIDGGDQKGRNDGAKLGFLTLDIFETGHVAHYHRSYGATLAEGAAPPGPPVARPHIKTSTLKRLFVDMRRAFAEEIVVAPSGAVDEFQRKTARNDYPLMALWEMGIRDLRVPFQDLADDRTRRRMEIMADVGHRFQVYRYGLPTEAEAALLKAHAGLVDRFELVTVFEEVPGLVEPIRALGRETGVPLHLSRVNRKDVAKHSGGRFNHLISHGFTLGETGELAAWLADHPGLFAGVQFTIMRSESPWMAAAALADFAAETGVGASLYVKLTEASAADSFEDDQANARRVLEAAMAALGHPVSIVLDTFEDADRGYFVRTGLVDRRYNPRLAGRLLATLVHDTQEGIWRAAGGDTVALIEEESGRRVALADFEAALQAG